MSSFSTRTLASIFRQLPVLACMHTMQRKKVFFWCSSMFHAQRNWFFFMLDHQQQQYKMIQSLLSLLETNQILFSSRRCFSDSQCECTDIHLYTALSLCFFSMPCKHSFTIVKADEFMHKKISSIVQIRPVLSMKMIMILACMHCRSRPS